MNSLSEKLAGKRFLIIGRAGMDFYPDPPGTRTEEATHFFACLGGSSANIAVALTKQGCSTALVTCVADDAIGRFCLNELDKYGIDRKYVRSVGGDARNSLAVVETRVEDHQSVIYRNGAADLEMSNTDIEQPDLAAYSALITTGTVFVNDPSRSATFKAFESARKAGLPIIFDIDYRPYSWPSREAAAEVYSKAGSLSDIIIGNDVEFGFMAGDYSKGLDKARSLVAEGAQICVYKMGEKGSVTITQSGEFRSGIYKTHALKPTGAGDSFMGGFVSALANGRSIEEAVDTGAASAAIVVSRVGCAPAMPDAQELRSFMAETPRYAIAE